MEIIEVEKLVASAWSKFTEIENADFIAKTAVTAALQKDSRMNPLASNLRDLKSYKQSANRSCKIRNVSDSLTLYDLNGNPGIVFLQKILNNESDRAKKMEWQYQL